MSADPLDWDEVYRTQAPRLRGVIARRVEAGAVEDVLQETFLRAYRSSDRFDASRPIEPWLTTIAVHAAADSRRRTAREPLVRRIADVRVGHAPDVAEEYVANERGRLVRRAEDFAEAVASAIKAVESAVPGARVVEVHRDREVAAAG